MGGGAAAYQQLERLPDDLGNAMEGIASRQQADKQAAAKTNEERRVKKQERADEFAKETEVNKDDFFVQATNWNDADEIFNAVSQKAMLSSTDLFAQARKAWDSGDEETARKLQADANRIHTSFKNFSSQRDEFAAIITDIRGKIESGKILSQSEGQFIDALDKHEYTAEYKDGDFIITALARDKNGDPILNEDGTVKRIVKSMNDVRKGLDRPFEFEEATGKGGMIDNMMVNFGLKKYDEVEGDYIISSQTWDISNEVALKNYVDGVTGLDGDVADNREMYKWYKNATGKEKFKGWTDEDKAVVEAYIRDGVASQYPEEVALKIRGLTATEKKTESALERTTRVKINTDNINARAAEGEADREAAMKRLKLQLEAQAEEKAGKKPTKEEVEEEGYTWAYDIAKEIADLNLEGLSGDERTAKVKAIAEREGISFEKDTWLFGDWQFDIAGESDLTQKEVFKIAQAIMEESGLKYDKTKLSRILSERRLGKKGNTTGGASRFNPQQ